MYFLNKSRLLKMRYMLNIVYSRQIKVIFDHFIVSKESLIDFVVNNSKILEKFQIFGDISFAALKKKW